MVFSQFGQPGVECHYLHRIGQARIVSILIREAMLNQLELSDFDVDQQLLQLPGTSLLIFTSVGCASCRYARQQLPTLDLALERICWIDAAESGGAVTRYEVFHLPALFVIRDGQFYGALRASLTGASLRQALEEALTRQPDELP